MISRSLLLTPRTTPIEHRQVSKRATGIPSFGDTSRTFRAKRQPVARKAAKPLACPFFKSNPSKYKDCFKRRLRGVAQLTQHLSRCHYTSAYSCKACPATFSREVDLKEHLVASSKCILHPGSFSSSGRGFTYSISTADWDTIKDVAGRRAMSLEARWEGIWHVLFPNRPAPPSPHAETDFSSVDLFLFSEHLTSTGSEELFDLFERKRLRRESMAPADISKFLEGFCRDWAQRQDSITSTDKDEPRIQESSAPSPESRVDGKASVPNEVKTVLSNKSIDFDQPPPCGAPCHTSESIEPVFIKYASLPPLANLFVNSVYAEPLSHSWSNAATPESSYGNWRDPDLILEDSSAATDRASDDKLCSFSLWEAPKMKNSQISSKTSDSGEQIAGNTAWSNADSDAKSPGGSSRSTVKKSDSSSPVPDNERSDNESSPLTDESGSQTSSEGTPSLDIFEFGDILVPDGSRFSSVLSAAVRALTVIYERESQIGTPYGMADAASDPTDAPEFSSSQNTPSDSAGSAGSSGIHSLPTTLTSQASSQRGDARQKRGREEDDEPKKSPPLKRKRIENGAKRLACPFQKRYPLKHFFCGARGETRGFVHISHIKDHIHRRHIRSVLYCPKCKKDFESSEKFAEHVMGQSCEKQPFRDETALPRTAPLAASLRARVGKALSLSEQWFSVWRILFPGEDEPGSCFVDDVPENMFQYQQFITRRGDGIVLDVIRAHGLLPDRDQPPGDDPEYAQRNEEELVAFAQRVFGLASEAIFQSWVTDAHQAHRAIPSGEQAHQSSDTPMNKGKALETDRTASNPPDRTNDEIPPITQAPPRASTHSAVQTVRGAIVMDQRASEVEDNNLTTSNPMHHSTDRSLSDVIQPMTTAARVLHASALPSFEMALNQAGNQDRGEGIAESSGSSRGADSDNAGISLDEGFMGFLRKRDHTYDWWGPPIFWPEGSDSGTNPPPW